MTGRNVIGLMVGAMLVAGCATPSHAPVMDRSESIAKPDLGSSAEYIVRPNDSLFAIAWKYHLDYRDLAHRNGIAPPYTIRPGQKLLLYAAKDAPETRPGRPAVAATPTVPTRAPRPAKPIPAPVSEPAVQPRPKPEVAKPVPQTRPTLPVAKPAPQQQPPPPAAKPVPQQQQPTPPAAQKAAPGQTGRSGWRWPVNAQPARGFGRGNNGLDYVLAGGQRVVAAAAGQVVYAGPGLGGYRHLIIVEHPDRYLSAYNINVEPAVAEGSRVASGGKICDIGSGSPATRRLHFEIRRNGTPVNPATIIGR